ncbi:MAG: hydantoinase/oxoprolinase family protein [Candidatus Heimdallarchaeota archaeon]|nr:hydantoinase/oxoprolinase family protein [Candidatus Heimdallarchaeota archaeon]MBY8994108.1 hydantoinase/oxoprolinase family protein [Candidatus Heimdallarchaeota archaeon]
MIIVSKISIGIDIGGTFTDIIIQDKESGKIYNQVKVSTTPKKPEDAIIISLQEQLAEADKENVQQLYHATTIATNAFLGQVNLELPKTILITTKGFRDVLEIGRQRRASLYDFFFERPIPIVPRKYRFEIEERMNSQGEIVTPLKEDNLQTISDFIKTEKIQSIAISFLHSYRNAKHEQKIKEYFEKKHKGLYLSAGFEVSPEHREFERTSTTTINAVLMPMVSRYVKSLTDSFKKIGINAPLFIMQSSGGVSKSEQVQQLPVSIIESGPSAGVVASRFIADFLDLPKIISFDMGGTTAKAGTIVNKSITLTSEYEVGGAVHSGRITKGSGYPARFPFIDLAEISSGGGSIAWVDQGNALRVGPISAGADPGPACYGLKGEDPTITDANLVLGRLNPEGLLNKTFKIYPELAEKSIQKKIADPLKLDVIESALGIVKIANNNMSRILRIVTVERGLDPREFILNAFGGAGPLHACALAEELKISEIIIPNNPGLFSAMGLLFTDAKHTYVKSIRKKLFDIDYGNLEQAYQALETQGSAVLSEEGFQEKNIVHKRFVDLRYVGQGFELLIPLEGIALQKKDSKDQIMKRFNEKHHSIYGYVLNDEEVEMVNIRINSLGLIEKPRLVEVAEGTSKPKAEAQEESREVYFEEFNGFKLTPIYNREKLQARNELEGPAIIEQYDTTTVVPPNWKAKVDNYGLIHLKRM